MIFSTFYCIQPLDIPNEDLLKLYECSKKIDIKYKDSPGWLKEFQKTSNAYNNLKVIDNFSPTKELYQSYFSGENAHIANMIDKVFSYLIFDEKFMSFIVVYEVHIIYDIKFKELPSNLYTCIRSSLVKENKQSFVSNWTLEVETLIKQCLQTFLSDYFFYNLSLKKIKIKTNTGNVTNVINTTGLDSRNSSEQYFFELNRKAERLCNDKQPFEVNSVIYEDGKRLADHYFFNGRFHTIILNATTDTYRYIPIQFHMQFMWFYLIKLNSILDNINSQLVENNSLSLLKEKNDALDILINKTEMLTMFNETFKFAIEIDRENVYNRIQSKWNIENQLQQSNQYSRFFKDYLNRAQNKKVNSVDQKRNSVLFVITILQFMTVISIWNDYLQLLNSDMEENADQLSFIFNSSNYLETINLWMPVGLTIMLILLMTFVFIRKK